MLPGWVKGVVVGFINVIVVALATAVFGKGPRIEIFAWVMLLGFLPGTLCGTLVGHCAAEAKLQNRRVVLIAMIAFSCSTVAMLGDALDLRVLVPYACIPTAAGCAVLERWTRTKPDAIPFARVA